MHQSTDLELFPGMNDVAHNTFASFEEQEEFFRQLWEKIEPEMKRLARCRAESEHEARNRIINWRGLACNFI